MHARTRTHMPKCCFCLGIKDPCIYASNMLALESRTYVYMLAICLPWNQGPMYIYIYIYIC